MDPPRPSFIDLRSQSQTSLNSTASRPLRSPRLHVAGEAPPELSPLDAFAKQSRLLAKQLEESARSGNRVSRLPPLTTASPLIVQGRSEYFRSMSQDSASGDERSPQTIPSGGGLGVKTEVEETNRPMSMHPRMSRIPPTPDDSIPLPTPPIGDYSRGRPLENIHEDQSYFGARQDRSPSPMGSINSQDKQQRSGSISQEHLAPQQQWTGTFPPAVAQSPERVVKKNSFDATAGLVPPRPIFPKRASSLMSTPIPLPVEPAADDDAYSSSMSTSVHSLSAPRKLSNSSVSPGQGHFQRSPSISSDLSAPLPRPSFNFSRPLSRAGTPVLDSPARQASSDSHASFILADESVHTPVSMHSECFPDATGEAGASTYTYSKFALPRGKALQRSGPDGQQWEQPGVPGTGQAPPSPPSRPSSSAGNFARPSTEKSKLSTELLGPERESPFSQPMRPSTSADVGRSSEDVPRGRSMMSPPTLQRSRTAVSTTTSDSNSTVKPPKSMHSLASAAEIPAEEHVDKAIALHEQGSLNESTYHLRHAARQNHPTGMLLYALACRHGWGMRPNATEGAMWLRKAADAVSHEIEDDEAQLREGKNVDFLDRKTRKAQFALSIYELGVSYMNGWGIDQDKALALKCFEIAGSWGDVDALAEAGFCYAQGVGCKKNLKKSADFYRQAEAKGMSMVGNSWIHKSKYNEDDKSKKDKKNRSKSRTRNIFGIKSSH